jgi:hypothetical protein
MLTIEHNLDRFWFEAVIDGPSAEVICPAADALRRAYASTPAAEDAPAIGYIDPPRGSSTLGVVIIERVDDQQLARI